MKTNALTRSFFELSKKFRREFFRLGLNRIEKEESVESRFLGKAYINHLFKSWKDTIVENGYDDSYTERDIKWRVELLLSEALEEKNFA